MRAGGASLRAGLGACRAGSGELQARLAEQIPRTSERTKALASPSSAVVAAAGPAWAARAGPHHWRGGGRGGTVLWRVAAHGPCSLTAPVPSGHHGDDTGNATPPAAPRPRQGCGNASPVSREGLGRAGAVRVRGSMRAAQGALLWGVLGIQRRPLVFTALFQQLGVVF